MSNGRDPLNLGYLNTILRKNKYNRLFGTILEAQSGLSIPTGSIGVMGIILEAAKKYPPANEVFTPEELEERLQEISDRVLVKEQDLKDQVEKARTVDPRAVQRSRTYLPPDLVICNCARCRKVLLGMNSLFNEYRSDIRCKVSRIERVAGRTVQDRPLCYSCLVAVGTEWVDHRQLTPRVQEHS